MAVAITRTDLSPRGLRAAAAKTADAKAARRMLAPELVPEGVDRRTAADGPRRRGRSGKSMRAFQPESVTHHWVAITTH